MGYPGIHERIMLKLILQKGVRKWAGFNWLRMGVHCRRFVNTVMNLLVL